MVLELFWCKVGLRVESWDVLSGGLFIGEILLDYYVSLEPAYGLLGIYWWVGLTNAELQIGSKEV